MDYKDAANLTTKLAASLYLSLIPQHYSLTLFISA